MANEIDTLQLKITANATAAANGIDKLTESLSGLGKKLGPATLKNLSNMSDAINSIASAGTENAVNSITKLGTAFNTLTKAYGSISNFNMAMRGMQDILKDFFSLQTNSIQKMNELTVSFGNLAAKLNTIDATKITSLGASLRAFASSTARIDKVLSNISFTDVGLTMKKVESAVKDSTRSIISEWSILGDEAQNKVIVAIQNLANEAKRSNMKTMEDATAGASQAYFELADAITTSGRAANVSKKNFTDLLHYVSAQNLSGQKISLGFDGYAEFRDQFSDMRKTLGSVFTSKKGGTDFEKWITDLNGALGNVIPVGNTAAETFKNFYDTVVLARDGSHSLTDALQSGQVSTQEIEASINNLITSIYNMKTGGGGVENVFKTLTTGLQNLGNLNIPDSTNLANLVEAISRFGLQSASKAPANIEAISQALSNMLVSLSQVNVSNSGVASLVQSLSQLTTNLGSFTNTANTTTNSINMLNNAAQNASAVTVPAVQNMANTAQVAVSHGSAIPGVILGVVSSLGKLVSALGGLHITEKIAVGVQKLATAMGALTASMASKTISIIGNITNRLNIFGRMVGLVSTKTSAFASTIGMLYARFWMLRRVFNILNQAIQKSSDLVETQHIIDVTFGNSSYKLEEFAQNSIQSLGMAEVSAKQFAARFQSMGTALGYSQSEMADYSIELTRLAGNMASFYNRDYNDTAKALESIFTGQTKPLRQYGIDITQATLQEWALKRGIDAKVESMSQAEKMMLRYQYVMERLQPTTDDFVKTIDTWANQTRLLKENFKALLTSIGSILTNVFKPVVKVLNAVIGHVLKFVKTVGDALGTIFGWTMLVREGGLFDDSEDDYDTDFSDTVSGLEDVAKAAEEGAEALEEEKEEEEDLSRSIMGFDELNLLEPPIEEEEEEEDTGDELNNAADGANKAADAIGNMGDAMEEAYVAIVPKESAFKSSIDTLGKLGEYIGNTLYNMLVGIEWDKVYEGARGFGKGLAQFLNGLITPELFGIIGETLAGILNTIMHGLNAFAYEFDFENLGNSLKTGLDGFIKKFDTNLFDDTLKAWGKGIAQTLNGLFNPETAGSLGNMLGEGLNGIVNGIGAFIDEAKWKQYGEALNKAIQGFIDAVDLSNVEYVFGKAGKAIADFLNALADPVLWSKIGSFIAGWLNAFVNFFLKFVENLKWEEWGKAISTGMKSFMDSFDMENFQKLTTTLGTGIATFLNQLADKELWQKAGSFVAGWLNAIIGFFESFGKKLDWKGWGEAFNAGMTTMIGNIKWLQFKSALEVWGSGIASFLNGLITPELGGTLGYAVSRVGNSVVSGLNSFATKLDWKQMGESIASFFNNALEKFDWQKLGETISNWADGFLDMAIEFFADLNWNSLFTGLSAALGAIKWANIATKTVEAIWTALSGEYMKDDKKKQVSDSFSSLEKTLTNIGNVTFQGLKDLYNDVLLNLVDWAVGDGFESFSNIITNQLDVVDWDKLSKGIGGLISAIGKFTRGVFEGFIGFFEELSKYPLIGNLLNAIGDGLNKLFGSLDGRNYETIEQAGKTLGTVLAVFTTYKITTAIAGNIGTLATNIGSLLTTLVTSYTPVAILGGALAIIYALDELTNWFNNNNGLYETVKSTADEIDNLAATLAGGTISDDTDYKYIKQIIDEFFDLNDKLKNGGELTETEEAMFESYLGTLTEYVPKITEQIDSVTGAYTGTKEELSLLIEKQREQAEQEALLDFYKEMMKKLVEQKVKMDEVYNTATDLLLPQLDNLAKDHNIPITFSEEDLRSFVDYLAKGGDGIEGWQQNVGILTPEMQNFVKALPDGGAILELSGSLNKVWGAYDEGKRSIDKASESLETVEGMMTKTVETAEASEPKVTNAAELAHKKFSGFVIEDGKIVDEKLAGMTKTANEELGKIKKEVETAGDSITSSASEDSGKVVKSLDDVYSDMSEKLLPKLNELAEDHNVDIEFSEEDIKSLIDMLADGSVDSGLLTENMKNFMEKVTPQNITPLGDAVGDLWDKFFDARDPLGKTEEGIDGVKESIDDAVESAGNAKQKTSEAWSDVKTETETGAGNVETEIDTLTENVETKIDEHNLRLKQKGRDGMAGMGSGITENASSVTDSVQNNVLNPTDTLINQFNSKDVKENGQEFDNAYATGIKDNKSEVEGAADEIAEATVNPLDPGSGGNGRGGAGRVGMFQRISGAGKSLGLTLKSEYIGGATAALGITGDGNSTVFDAIGGQTIGGMVDGVNGKFPTLSTFMENLPENMKTVMGDVQTFFKPSGENAVSGMKDGTTAKNGELEKYFVQLPTKMSNAMTTLESTFKSVGKLMGNSIIRGLESKTEDLKTAGGNAYKYIKDAFSTVSTDFHAIGQSIMQNLVNGLNSIRPHIPVPHFSVSMGYSGTTPYPVINGPAWYAKGGLATNASIVGIGEAGNEAILPLENRRAMQAIADSIASKSAMMDDSALENAMIRALATTGAGGSTTGENTIFNVVVKTENDEVLARAVTRGQKKLDYRQNPVSKM